MTCSCFFLYGRISTLLLSLVLIRRLYYQGSFNENRVGARCCPGRIWFRFLLQVQAAGFSLCTIVFHQYCCRSCFRSWFCATLCVLGTFWQFVIDKINLTLNLTLPSMNALHKFKMPCHAGKRQYPLKTAASTGSLPWDSLHEGGL